MCYCVIVTTLLNFLYLAREVVADRNELNGGKWWGYTPLLAICRSHPHQEIVFSPFVRRRAVMVSLPTDAPPPYVGSYPYRTSAGGSTPASRAVTREQEARQSLAANLAMHYAAPAIADDDPTVAQGLRYPQR